MDTAALNARLAELADLRDAWLDGEGLALTPHALATASTLLGRLATEHPDAPCPHVFPTPEGAVSAEWVLGRVSADVYFPAKPAPITGNALHVDSDREADVTVATDDPTAAAQIAAWLRVAADLARSAP